jgi:uncharacterized flavoprotein (TIGR03862 family)
MGHAHKLVGTGSRQRIRRFVEMPEAETVEVLIIGSGPAGLMAAEDLSGRGHRVVIAESKASPARKLLMAGKSGLNITKVEPLADFTAAYQEAADWLAPMLAAFGPQDVMDWAEGLGSSVFTGTSGRAFPAEMKASRLLRTWLTRLAARGAQLRTRWRWVGWEDGVSVFDTPDGRRRVRAQATVLAMGGASWARLGSDGAWTVPLAEAGVRLDPFAPANVGVNVNWTAHMDKHFGAPVKAVALVTGDRAQRGEFVITRHGLEGGGIYAISRAVREGQDIVIDLVPGLTVAQVRLRLEKPRGRQSMSNHLRRTLGLDPVKIALVHEFLGPLPPLDDLAPILKALPLRHDGTRPMDEAISVAGGVQLGALDDTLMLTERPGTFCCGEMIGWEAPTGGYLLTACLATGRTAGRGASDWLDRHKIDRRKAGNPQPDDAPGQRGD